MHAVRISSAHVDVHPASSNNRPATKRAVIARRSSFLRFQPGFHPQPCRRCSLGAPCRTDPPSALPTASARKSTDPLSLTSSLLNFTSAPHTTPSVRKSAWVDPEIEGSLGGRPKYVGVSKVRLSRSATGATSQPTFGGPLASAGASLR